MTYLILMIILASLGFICYYFYEKDILSPSVISCGMFLFCTFLAFLGLFSWNEVKNLSLETIGIVLVGIIAFILGEFLARKTTKEKEKKNSKELQIIKIDSWKYVLSIIGIVLTIFLLIIEIKRICAYYGFQSNHLPKLLAFYRTKTPLFSTDLITDGVDVNFIVKQMKKCCDVLCIIFMYIVANNILAKDSPKRILKYSIPIALTLFTTLLNSGRSMMMHMLVGFLMMFLILFQYKNKKIPKKAYFYLGGALVGSLLLFYFVAPLLGRGTKMNFLQYITFYLGAPLPSFNHFLTHMPVHAPYFGFETFSGIYATLNKLHIVDALQIGSREWVEFSGFNSNVYMSFRRLFFDFGIVGVFIGQFIFGFVISKLYLKIKDLKYPLLFLIYGFYAYILIDQIRDEQFFGLFGSTLISYLILISFFYFVYFKLNINFRKKKK